MSIDANPFWEPLTGGLGAQDVVVIREHMDALRAANQRLSQTSSMPERVIERLTHVAEELRLPREMAGLSVAETNGWLFDSSKSLRNIDRLAATYPAVFQLGGYKEIDNQFWGFIDGDRRGLWLGRLNYIEGRSPVLSHDTVFAFETKGTASLDFSVVQHSAMDSLDDSAGDRALTTESEYFNSELHIDYAGDRGLVGPDIMQVLSPQVQEALLSFNRKHDEFRMDVSKGVLWLALGGNLPAGAMDIQRAIDSAVGLAETMLRCLDRVAG